MIRVILLAYAASAAGIALLALSERHAGRQRQRRITADAAALVAEVEQHNADAADVLAEAESIVRAFASSIGVQ